MIARRVCLAVVIALCCAAPATVALAARAPSPADLSGIARVVGAPGPCLYVRVSTVDQSFAKLAFRTPPTPACERYAANGVTVVRRHRGHWHLVFAGSVISCPIRGVPAAVARDLRICP